MSHIIEVKEGDTIMTKITYAELEEWVERKGYHVNTLYIMMDEEGEERENGRVEWDEQVADWILEKWGL